MRDIKKFSYHTIATAISLFIVLLVSSAKGIAQESEKKSDTYSIKIVKGVPFIAKNGKTQRGRMFYGAYPGGTFKNLNDNWKIVSMNVTPTMDTENAGIRMSFDGGVKNVFIKKILLRNLTTNIETVLFDPSDPILSKTIEKSDPKRADMKIEDGVLHISKQTDPKAPAVRFYIKKLNLKKSDKYRVEVEAKYDTRGWFDMVAFANGIIGQSAEKTFIPQLNHAAKNGVNFVTLGFPCFTDPTNVAEYEKICENILGDIIKNNPKAKIIPRLGADATKKWLDENPDSEMRNFDGTPTTRVTNGNMPIVQRFAAVSSKKYRQNVSEILKRTVEFLEAKYGDNIAGYHPSGANTGEWFYAQSYSDIPTGYDKSTLAAWREWLAVKYKNDDTLLQKAWNKNDVKISTANVPTYDERMKEIGFIINPAERQNVIDFNLFLNDEMADTVLTFSKAVREASGGKKLILAFYGYGFELSSLPISPAVSGHFALRKVLDSPYVDILAGPISYGNRGKGGIKNTMGASESCPLAGKIWCDEDDNRTYLMWESGSILLVPDPNQKTQKDSIAVMRRNLAQQIIRNNPSWWMDLFGTGWYNDPVLWEQVPLFKKAELDMIKRPRPYNPEVALVYDDASMSYIGRQSTYTTGTLMYGSRRVAHKIGAPFGQYLLDDILDGRASPKLNLFLNVVSLDSNRRAKMREAAKKSACIYAWATGYVDPEKREFSEKNIEDATGFKVEKIEPSIPYAVSTDEGLKAGFPEILGSNNNVKMNPLFSPIPREGDIILAKYINGKPAVILRPNGNTPQLFYGLTFIQPEVMRYMAELADAHIYTKQPASVFANGAYVSVCATTEETHTIDFGCDKKIYDALTGKFIGKGPVLNFDMYKGDTIFLRIGRGNK